MPPKKKTRVEPVWEYEGDDASWTAYGAEDSKLIEDAFVKCKGAGTHDTGAFSFNKGYKTIYTLNFDTFVQINNDSGRKRNFRRFSPLSEISWEFKDDASLFVQFYEADALEIDTLFHAQGINKPTTTKNLSWNKGYGSNYEFVFTKITKSGGATATVAQGPTDEVFGTQKNLDSGTVREIKRVPKQAPWPTTGYGISGDKDAISQLKQMGVSVPSAPPSPAKKAAVEVATTTTAASLVAPPTPSAPVAPAANAGLNRAPTLALPPYWEQCKVFAGLGDHAEVPVDPNTHTDEYKKVVAMVLDSFGEGAAKKRTIHDIYRLENPAMYTFYAMTRDTIAQGPTANPSKTYGENANEKMLFAGERVQLNMLSIKKFGFDTRTAAEGAYGKGLYFGSKATFVDNGRCFQNPKNGTKELFLCRVTLGLPTTGKQGIRRPPYLDEKKGASSALYDSCHDGLSSPDLYVIFNSKQVYPEYRVVYE